MHIAFIAKNAGRGEIKNEKKNLPSFLGEDSEDSFFWKRDSGDTFFLKGDSGDFGWESTVAAPSTPTCNFVSFSVGGVKDFSTPFFGFVVPTESIGTSAGNSKQMHWQKKLKKNPQHS